MQSRVSVDRAVRASPVVLECGRALQTLNRYMTAGEQATWRLDAVGCHFEVANLKTAGKTPAARSELVHFHIKTISCCHEGTRAMKRDLHGLRILVTGASSGIGRSIAEQAALEGARVALAARSRDKLAELEQSLKQRSADAIAITAHCS